MEHVALLVTASFINALSQVFLKASTVAFGKPVENGSRSISPKGKALVNLAIALALFSASLAMYLYVIREADVSAAFALMSMTSVFVAIIAYYWMKEGFDSWKLSGLAFIALGTSLLGVTVV